MYSYVSMKSSNQDVFSATGRTLRNTLPKIKIRVYNTAKWADTDLATATTCWRESYQPSIVAEALPPSHTLNLQ
jgi:hypothetical protein